MDKLIKLTDGVEENDSVYYIRLSDIIGIVKGRFKWEHYVYVRQVRGGLSIDAASFEKVKRLLEEELGIK